MPSWSKIFTSIIIFTISKDLIYYEEINLDFEKKIWQYLTNGEENSVRAVPEA